MAEVLALGLLTVRVLVIGSGAREHALLLALRRDPEVDGLAVAPGNAGTSAIADQYGVDVTSGEAVVALAQRIDADLVVIGPEVPLVLGVADAVRAAGIACFGPTKDAARIEGSKSFAKDVMAAAGVRTAASEIVDNPAHLDAALDRFGPAAGDPAWVVKDDGLAAGKGVVVSADRDVARAHAASLLDSGHPVLLESFLDGPEVSLFSVVDGETVVPLLPAQDFKRVGDGDTGPNTGGMGAYAPLPWLSADVVTAIVDDVIKPVAAELVRRGSAFSGLLYAGLSITSRGPAVVEFNCRFGDPETQAMHPRCAGATVPPSRSYSPPRTIRAGRGSATSSSAPRRTACCTQEPPAATTAPSCRQEGACCRSSERAPTSNRRGRPPTA
jgi:phosphoribosylamine---glycine ligase